MKFAIDKAYPPNFRYANFLEDHETALRYLIRASGHRLDDGFDTEPTTFRFVLGAHLGPCLLRSEHIVINTERVANGEFIHGDLGDYLDCLYHARAVWSLYPDDTAFLRENGVENAQTWHYGPDVFPRYLPRAKAPVCDFVHIGSVTESRRAFIKHLTDSALDKRYNVRAFLSVPFREKVAILTASKASLALAYDERKTYLPWPRIVFAASQGCRSLTDIPVRHDHEAPFGFQWCTNAAEEAIHDVWHSGGFDSVAHFRDLVQRSN